MKHLLTSLICGLLLLVHTANAQTIFPEGAAVESDFWYVLQLDGQNAGWMRTATYTLDEQRHSFDETHLAIRRGATEMLVMMSSDFTETLDGQPVHVTQTMSIGAMPTTTTMVFTEQGRTLTTRQGDNESVQELGPIEVDWMVPSAMEAYITQQQAAGAREITVRTLDLSTSPDPTEIYMQRLREEPAEVFGRVAPATLWQSRSDAAPGVNTLQHLSPDGQLLRSVTPLGGLTFTALAADRELALADIDAPELMARTFITPDQTIDNPRQSRRAMYRLIFDADADLQAVDFPRAGFQRVVWGDDRTAIVVVDMDDPVNPGEDLPTDEHLAASLVLNHEDPAIRALAEQALPNPDGRSQIEQAEAMHRFVYEFIEEKDFSVGFATASEVALTGQGDCTEHGVLLAALLRTQGIPSRTVTGLIYADVLLGQRAVFGYHMWTQAWIDDDDFGGRWVDLDAVLPPAMAFDATHIALMVSPLADNQVNNDMVALLPFFDAVQIEVQLAE